MTKILRILLLFLLSFSYSFGDSCSVIDKNIKAGFSYATSKGEEILVTDFVHIPYLFFKNFQRAKLQTFPHFISFNGLIFAIFSVYNNFWGATIAISQ